MCIRDSSGAAARTVISRHRSLSSPSSAPTSLPPRYSWSSSAKASPPEKPPALYDLTTLQRDANRLLGFTAQQTLDYLQSLYEKKLCTYPRTDSRYLTGDMADSLPVLVNLVANAMPFRKGIAITCDSHAVINDKKVTDHHAVIPCPV